jgi:hypothetical protein
MIENFYLLSREARLMVIRCQSQIILYSLESFGLIGIQLPEKYKENFDVSSEGASAGSE